LIAKEQEHLVLTSVVPAVTRAVRSRWPAVVVVDHRCDLPFEMDAVHAAEVGPDRLCNMATAAARGFRRALVIDAGTATTFDLLVDQRYIGGLIAPGMALAAQYLGEAAARLAPVPFSPCALAPQTETTAAMRAGAYHVGVAGVRGVVAGLDTTYGPLEIVLTGGLCEFLAAPGWICDPHWTLRGAAVLAGLYRSL